MSYSNIIEKVSEELHLNKDLVDRTYKAYWLFIRECIQSLPLKKDINEDEFNKLCTNFNIPSLGKLSSTFDRVQRIKKRDKIINSIKERKDAKD